MAPNLYNVSSSLKIQRIVNFRRFSAMPILTPDLQYNYLLLAMTALASDLIIRNTPNPRETPGWVYNGIFCV
jgi:hypothetical protein